MPDAGQSLVRWGRLHGSAASLALLAAAREKTEKKGKGAEHGTARGRPPGPSPEAVEEGHHGGRGHDDQERHERQMISTTRKPDSA